VVNSRAAPINCACDATSEPSFHPKNLICEVDQICLIYGRPRRNTMVKAIATLRFQEKHPAELNAAHTCRSLLFRVIRHQLHYALQLYVLLTI
jgi:hypothetical protein